MKLSTIFSKTGKGLQEASGKTSHLSRSDRSVLMAIDGKLTVAELAQRVGKSSDFKFQQMVEKLETQGFIREVAPVPSAATSAPRPPNVITPRPPKSTPAPGSGSDDGSDDLDFTQAFSLPKRPGSSKPAAPSKPVDLAAKAHETASPGGAAFDYKARAEAEAKAKAEAEKKARAEAEARAKAIAEAKAKAEAEAKQREAEKAKVWARELAEAEAKAAREAIARAEAEEARARKEAEDKKRREEEERKAKIEAEKRAKEEAERKAKEEAERRLREEEERKLREEEERKAKIEAEKRAKEEAERKAKEEAERKRREEEDRRRREEEERRRKEEEERQRREEEARRRKEEEERKRREEEERKRKEEEERKRREAEERARREEEERKRKEEEERKRQEEEERARREEEERQRREAEERRRREEEERRKRREEEDRRRAEEDERRRIEDEEIRRREEAAREAEERPFKEAEERQRLEEDQRRAEEDERRRREDEARELEDRKRRSEDALREKEEALRRKEEALLRKEEEVRRAEEERQRREAEAQAGAKSSSGSFDLDFLGKKDDGEGKREAKASGKPSGGSFAERLLADLDLFGKKDDEESKRKEEEARKAREEAAERKAREKEEKKRREEEAKRAKAEAKAREEAERKAKIEAERRAKEEAERNAKEEVERKAREETERKAREEKERKERDKRERRRKAAAPSKPAPVSDDEVIISDDDLGMDDVLRDEAKLTPQAREAMRARAREERRREKQGPVVAAPPKFRRPIRWGKPVTVTLLVALVAGAIAVHVTPIAPQPYEQLASEAIGQPVKIGAARMSLLNGFEIHFENVRVGDMFKAQEVRAAPEFAWLLGDHSGFRRIDIEGGTLAQSSLAQLLLGKLNEARLRVQRVTATRLRLDGPLPLPLLDADIQLSSTGTMRFGSLTGPDKLQLKLGRLGSDISLEARAERLPLPFMQELVLSDFYMKATGNAGGMNVSEWDGRLYSGVLKGNARMQWKDGWSVQGEMRIVEMNAAVFAPAVVSAGTAEASGKFTLSGQDPAKLGQSARLEGKLSISRGVLGSVDLSRAIQTGGRNVAGRTQFNELSADGVYDRGAVALRNVAISAGALSATARADISAEGRLSGRIAAEVKTPSQQLRSMVELSGTAKEPQASGN